MRYGVVFSGGGALGAWEIGCYEAIKGRHGGDAPLVVTGASAGALNAAGVCAGMPPPQLQALWAGISTEDVCRFRFSNWDALQVLLKAPTRGLRGAIADFLSRHRGIYETESLKATLRRSLSGYYSSFAQSQIWFAVSLTNLNSGRREYFYKLPTGSLLPEKTRNRDVLWVPVDGLEMLLDALVGSTALPVLFPPNGPYFDGGVLLNQPITPALLLNEPEVLYVVIPSAKALGRTDNIVQIAQTVLSTWLSASLVSQLDRLRLINRMRRDSADDGQDDRIPVCVIRPPEDLTIKFGVDLLSFGCQVDQLVSAGRQAAAEKLDRFDPRDPDEASWYDS